MKEEIKIELYQHDNCLCGRVLEMPEELRNKGLIINNADISIESYSRPALLRDTLFLRGKENKYDNDWFICSYATATKAAEIKNYIKSLIAQWNEEHREILTDKEKEYLAQVIRPFKDKVIGIRKSDSWSIEGIEYIIIKCIHINPKLPSNDIFLPFFEEGTMYKDMKINKYYTLKELGLE